MNTLKKKFRILFVALVTSFICSFASHAQVVISGIVTDQHNDPLPGVSVSVKNSTQGNVTDADGNYKLSVASGSTLVFSYIGYETKELTVGNENRVLNVILTENTQLLEEVVVVGYGIQKKVNMTGAISSVDMSKMVDSRPITSLSAGLAGMAAGVSVTQGNGGRPGYDGATIRVRGQGTLNNSDPLVVIDGVPGSMNDINPQDVESISILKDAASSAIYGSRAANGVILITTRKGKTGEAKISYNGYVTKQKIAKKIDLVSNYADYMELFNEAQMNSNLPAIFSREKIDEWRAAGNSDPVKYPNSDWQDAAFDSGWLRNHTLSVSGGSDKLRYFVSGNYMNNPGIMENSGYDRYSARVNLDTDVKKWFTVGVNAYGYRGKEDLGLYGTEQSGNLFYSILQATTPGICYKAPDGRYGGVNNPEDDAQSGNNNILRTLNNKKGHRTTNKVVSRFFAQVRPFKGLSIESSFTYDFTNNFRYEQPVFHDLWNLYANTIQTAGTGKTKVTNYDEKGVRNHMDGIIRYETNISKLNIQATLGASQESYRYNWFSGSKEDLAAPEMTELNAGTANASVDGNYTNWAMNSVFGRINLNWSEKYLFEANLRMDQSSRFAPGQNRRGFFPSFSAGWRISEEDLMKDNTIINNLKLRASYGSLGNNSVGDYDYQMFYSAQNYILNNAVQIGMAQRALSNAGLTWETTYVTNAGVDFGWSGLNGSLDFFMKNTKDILIDLPAPLVHGNATIPKTNAGKVRNTGIELNLSWNDRIGQVDYFIGGNFTYVKNKVTEFKGKESSISGTNMILEGQPINIQYVLSVDRIIQTEEDLALVQAMVDANPDAFSQYKRPEPGDFLYKDTNKDGRITDDDRVMVGNGTNPTTTYGINFGASWKGFDFSCILQGSTGLKVYWDGLDGASFWPQVRRGNQINKTIADGRWYPGRTDATYPRLLDYSDGRNRVASDFWVQDKSYMRVKNIQIGYTIPKQFSQRIMIEALRLYVGIDNALTFTDYPGLDPEVSGTRYPTMRLTTFGANLTF
jgi:TonB-linked SusC/RagA family outer membrane protein